MKNPLTVHILTKDNESDICSCLESVRSLPCEIIVGDLGSKDSTREKCRLFDAKIYRISLNDSLARARNELASHSETPWNMWIRPEEIIISGHEAIMEAMASGKDKAFNIHLMQGDIVTKPARIWHHDTCAKFKNHAFETLDCVATDIDSFLVSSGTRQALDIVEICTRWHASMPLSAEPLYYLACAHLQRGSAENFLNYAESYLHAEKKQQMSYFMIKYYICMVLCYHKKDYRRALENIIPCLAKCPAMAEFWCVAGDVFYNAGDYSRAISMYTNALVVGERRRSDSCWPMEVSKYGDYPKTMIESCKTLAGVSKVYVGRA